jgi:hypothetical protein
MTDFWKDYEPEPTRPAPMTTDRALDLALEFVETNHFGGQDAFELITAIKQARSAPVQDLPFGVGGGLVAIKTLLSRDPCVHANTAIEMIDAILKEHPAAQHQCKWPTCQSEEYQQALAEQIKQELVTGAAQPAVPDAFGTREGEHPQYIQGWNDCRAEMLSMRKRVKP